MVLPNSGIENHPSGIGNLNAIVDGNWNKIDNWCNPAYGLTATRAGATVTASAAIFTADMASNSDRIRFANGTEAIITGFTDSTHVTVGTSGTVASQAFMIFAGVTESLYTFIARALAKIPRAADIPDGYQFLWSASLQRFVPSPNVAVEPLTYLNTANATVANTTVETSILGRGAGANIVADTVAVGSQLSFKLMGTVRATNATQLMTLRVSLGGNLLALASDTDWGTTARNFVLEGVLKFNAPLGSHLVRGHAQMLRYGASSSAGVWPLTFAAQNTGLGFAMNIDRVFDVTAEWANANASNEIIVYDSIVKLVVNAN